MPSKRCYYEVLEVTREADEETLKKSYRRLAMKFHPDRNPGDKGAEEQFKEAAEAYEVLRDPHKRRRYDRYGHAGVEELGTPDFSNVDSILDIFGSIFGGGGRRRGPQRGRDLHVAVEIDLVEAYAGVTKEIKVPRAEACQDCSGSGAKKGTRPSTCRRCNGQGAVLQGAGFFRIQQTCPGCGGRGEVITDPCAKCRGHGAVEVTRAIEVAIPAGVDTETVVRVSGEGEAGDAGAHPGDLYCVLRVRRHPLFVRQGQELHCEVPITFSQAALGGPVEVPTLDGKFLTQHLGRGSHSGDEIRVTGKGMPNVRGGRRGDLVVHLKVVTPTNLTKRQEELLRELAQLDGQHGPPERKSFFDRVREFFNATAAKDASPKP